MLSIFDLAAKTKEMLDHPGLTQMLADLPQALKRWDAFQQVLVERTETILKMNADILAKQDILMSRLKGLAEACNVDFGMPENVIAQMSEIAKDDPRNQKQTMNEDVYDNAG